MIIHYYNEYQNLSKSGNFCSIAVFPVGFYFQRVTLYSRVKFTHFFCNIRKSFYFNSNKGVTGNGLSILMKFLLVWSIFAVLSVGLDKFWNISSQIIYSRRVSFFECQIIYQHSSLKLMPQKWKKLAEESQQNFLYYSKNN